MQGVLIDDHRIHVDFSQSVSSYLRFLFKLMFSVFPLLTNNRCLNCRTTGEMQLYQSGAHKEVVLVG